MTEKLNKIKPIHGLWVQPDNKAKVIYKGNALKPQVYHDLTALLKAVGDKLYEIHGHDGALFLVAVCPECNGVLGQMLGSKNVICLHCGREYKLTEYMPTQKPRIGTEKHGKRP